MGNEFKDALGELYVEHMHIAIKALTIANSIGIPKNDEERALLAKLLEKMKCLKTLKIKRLKKMKP